MGSVPDIVSPEVAIAAAGAPGQGSILILCSIAGLGWPENNLMT